MIKVEITNKKAPWPEGAGAVGVVVLLAVAVLPAWAVGKCVPLPVDDEREPVAIWEPPQIDGSDPQARAFVVNPAEAANQLAEQAARVAELGQQLIDAEQALGTARAEVQSLCAKLAEQHRELIAEKAALEEAEAANERTEGHLLDAIQERDAARAELASLRAAVPAVVGEITGDGTGEALLPIADTKAVTKASKKAAA